MAFDVRCPSCKAKMRFEDDALPKRGDPIDCPKCHQTFPAPSPNAFEEQKKEEKPKADDAPKKKKPRTVEAVPRTYFNHWLLLLITGGLMSILIAVLSVVWVVVAKAAKAEDMMACVPDNFNVIRGVNLKSLRNYPGVQANGDKFYDAEAQGIYAEAAGKLGLAPGDIVYYVCAREAGSNAVLHLFATKPSFDPSGLGDGQPVNLSRGVIATAPTRYLIVAASGRNANATLTTAAQNARSKPSDGMHTKIGTTGKLATRGQIWTVFRNEGTLKGWLAAGSEAIKEDGSLTKLRTSMGQASVLATWVSFGSNGTRMAAGLELEDSKAASDLVQDMKKGPLGKADESEPPNAFKKAMSQVANVSTNGAYWQYLEYRQSGSCAYAITRVEDVDKANMTLGEYVNPSRGAPGSGGGFGGGFGGGPR
jgi:predicted Zn finger-like uncharacterized protein